MGEVTIRAAVSGDMENMLALEKLCFLDAWSKNMFAAEFKNPAAHYFIAETDGEIAGYGGFWQIIDEGHIMNIAVHPGLRSRGIGSLLLKTMTGCAKSLGAAALFLEVRKSNTPAIRLYEKFGFFICGIRKGYYADNGEDAIVMANML